jgi:hypothetical protein
MAEMKLEGTLGLEGLLFAAEEFQNHPLAPIKLMRTTGERFLSPHRRWGEWTWNSFD